jgi:hypothetical protein
MTIDVRIDAISIIGLTLDARDADLLRAQIGERLAELIRSGGFDQTAAASIDSRTRAASDLRLADSRPVTLATEIAGAVYGQIGNQSGSRP